MSIKFIYKKLKEDYSLRTFIFGLFSLAASIFLGVFNLYVGFKNNASWNIAIAPYYFIIAFMRSSLFLFEYKIRKLDHEEKTRRRIRAFIIYGILLLIMDITLVWPISLILAKEKSAYNTTITAIIFAAYTFYRIGLAIYNMYKTRRGNYNLSVRLLKILTFTSALVSLMNLQSILILTFGSYDRDMTILSTADNGLIWLILLSVSIVTFKNGLKLKKENSNN